MSLSLFNATQPKNAAFTLPIEPKNLFEFVLNKSYYISIPFLDIVAEKPLKTVKEVSLEVSTLLVTAAITFLEQCVSPKFRLIDGYENYLKYHLSQEIEVHTDALDIYVNERVSFFYDEITSLQANQEKYDVTILVALLTKWPLTEIDVIETEIERYKEVGIHVVEPVKQLLFKQLLISSIGLMAKTISEFLNIELA